MTTDSAPRPPGFHWTLVLILGIATLGLFGCIWAIVQAVWARKIDPSSKAVRLYIIAIGLYVVGGVLEAVHADVLTQALVQVAAALVATFGAFSVKDSLARYMTNVEGATTYLSGLMTIIFGEVYLQYHMNRVRSFQRHHPHGVLAGAQ
jgi:hypothetical protein